MGKPDNDKYQSFYKGQTIIREGQRNPVAYVIKRGTVAVCRSINNRKVVLARLGSGQMFGEMGLITGQPSEAAMEAAEYVELLVLDQDVLKTLLIKSPGPVQRLMRQLQERLAALNAKVAEQLAPDVFSSVSHLLDLCCVAAAAAAAPAPGEQPGDAARRVGHAQFSRVCRKILLVSQAEIDQVLQRLEKVNLVSVEPVKNAFFRKNLLGETVKESEHVVDKVLTIKDSDTYLHVVRNLAKEPGPESLPRTEGLEFVDLYEFADMAGIPSGTLHGRIADRTVPSSLLHFDRAAAREWLEQGGAEALGRPRRKRLDLDKLETVDDVVRLDNATLKQAFQEIGFHKLSILFAAAGSEARGKILANLSSKMSTVVSEEAEGVSVEDTALADLESELFNAVRNIKKG